ncbi:MAG: PQQ-dependent sugar dehydrogenase [Anaerolineales bacterium]|nr:PQQ-dependent sugar dehydrogenase [Anaerolineales bacterium]
MNNERKYVFQKMVWFLGALLILGLGACAPQVGQEVTPTPTAPISTAEVSTEPPLPTATYTKEPTLTATAESSPTPTRVTTFPNPEEYEWSPVAEGFNKPIGLSTAGDGSGRLFIIEQPGRIMIIKEGQILEAPFLDIRDRVGDIGNEQGLLGLAFHPDYEENGFFYVNYTDKNGDTVVSRFTVSEDPNRADPATESEVLTISQPFANHNGGHVLFGPEGYLWISTGDGGSGGDPQGNAQNLDNLLGALLRVDVDQEPYAIPQDNPFGNEIWAYGLRNPWRFRFDPATGDLYIADVGQSAWEEIDYLPAGAPGGANFGWDYREGSHPFEGDPPEDADLIDPVAEYNQSSGDCSVSGGAVYRGSISPWQGVYLYGDFCSGAVRGLLQVEDGSWVNEVLFQTGYRIVAISQDEAGEVYLLDIRGGVYRLSEK